MTDHDQKPFADVGMRRHSDDDKRHGLHGKTCRRLTSGQAFIEEKLDRQLPCSRTSRSVKWTAFEVEGERDCLHSLRDSFAWEHVPALLHQHTIEPPLVQKCSDGTLKTTYQLEPVLEQIFQADADDQTRRGARKHGPATDGKLYQLRPHSKRPVLFALPPTEAPGGVRGKLLQPVRMGEVRSTHCLPIVRKDHMSHAWDVTHNGGVGNAQLTIDLGADCLLSHLSTQGRQPPTRQYPSVRRERKRCTANLQGQSYSAALLTGLGRRATRAAADARRTSLEEEEEGAEAGEGAGGYFVEGRPRWSLKTHGRYEGPFWRVVDLKGGRNRCGRTGRVYTPGERWLQWVSRYMVEARADGGRSWLPLGAFKGNTNATDEVAHDLGGLRARYVRITPLDVEGGGALRVGLYGLGAAEVARGESLASHGDACAAEEPPEPITYTLRTAPPSLNTKYTHCERHVYRYGRDRDWYGRDARSKVRLTRRLQAWVDGANGVEEAEWAAEWAEAELVADAMRESEAQAQAEAEAKAAAAEKVETLASIAVCGLEYAASFLAAHGGDLDRAVRALLEPTDGLDEELFGETSQLSDASSRLLLSVSACSSERSSVALAVDLADVTSEWSEIAEIEEDLISLPSDWEQDVSHQPASTDDEAID